MLVVEQTAENLPETTQGNLEAAIPGTLTSTSLSLPSELPLSRWLEVGRTLRAMERGVQWWVGDWLAFGEQKFGEEAFAKLDRSDKTLANWASTCRRVHVTRRREDVRFSHHVEVSSLEPAEQSEVLGEIAENGWGVRETRERVEEKRQEKAEQEHGKPQQHKQMPDCPTCGANAQHWQRVPLEFREEGEVSVE